MKRTAATLALLAGFGSGCTSPNGGNKETMGGFGTVHKGQPLPKYVGPNGEPVLAGTARGATPGGVVPASATETNNPALFRPAGTPADCGTCAHVPGQSWRGKLASKFSGTSNVGYDNMAQGGFAGMPDGGYPGGPGGGYPGGPGGGYPGGPGGGYPGGPGCYGGPGGPGGYGGGAPYMGPGILPVPGMGPPGAVAGVGAIVPGMGGPGTGALANGRSSIKFTGPAGMKVTWQLPGGGFNDESSGLTAPKEYNFLQGQVYRLRLTQILPNHPGKSFYPTLEVAAANPKTLTFLAHSTVPLTFTSDDFDHAVAGNLVVKVVYLPDRENQDFVTVAGGIEEVNSIRLEPGVDPVAEAQRKGTVLAIIRLGNIDLENKVSPAMNAVPPGALMLPPGGPVMIPGPGGIEPKKGPGLPPGMSSVPGFSAPVAPGGLPPIGNPRVPLTLPPVPPVK